MGFASRLERTGDDWVEVSRYFDVHCGQLIYFWTHRYPTMEVAPIALNFHPLHFQLNVSSTGRHLTAFEIKKCPQSANDGTFANPYGNRVLVKIARTLAESDHALRHQALAKLEYLFLNPINVVASISHDMIDRCLECAGEIGDDESRLRSTKCVLMMIKQRKTRDYIIHDEAQLATIKTYLSDPLGTVRSNWYRILKSIGEDRRGLTAIVVRDAFVPLLIKNLKGEQDEGVKADILQLMASCFRMRAALIDVMENDSTLSCVVAFLKESSLSVRANAALCCSQLAQVYDSRRVLLLTSAVPLLCDLLKEPLVQARRAASQSLMYIALDLEGKTQMLAVEAPKVLVGCLYDIDKCVRMNTLQCIATFTEHPNARENFKNEPVLRSIRSIVESTSSIEDECSAARRALEQIEWTP